MLALLCVPPVPPEPVAVTSPVEEVNPKAVRPAREPPMPRPVEEKERASANGCKLSAMRRAVMAALSIVDRGWANRRALMRRKGEKKGGFEIKKSSRNERKHLELVRNESRW